MNDFSHYVAVPTDIVMNNPSEYIIPENLKIIEYLWDMNILTVMTNDYMDNDSWIVVGILSKENEKLFNEMRNDLDNFFVDVAGFFRVPVKPGTCDTFDDFLPLFSQFQMQDVQRDGFMTIDEFYAKYTDCWKIIDNPYLKLDLQLDNCESVSSYCAFCSNYERMKYPKTLVIKAFDESKAVKSIEEYLDDVGLLDCYDSEEGKIFLNKRLYEGHMRYKNRQQIQKTKKHIK